jgi:hypothetical protein
MSEPRRTRRDVSCGIVGQSLYSFTPWRTSGSESTSKCGISTPYDWRMPAALAESRTAGTWRALHEEEELVPLHHAVDEVVDRTLAFGPR